MQAVRSRVEPRVEIPTDDHQKLYGKKLGRPEKSAAVAATKLSQRFRDQRRMEDQQ
jgi:hypothetical protein